MGKKVFKMVDYIEHRCVDEMAGQILKSDHKGTDSEDVNKIHQL